MPKRTRRLPLGDGAFNNWVRAMEWAKVNAPALHDAVLKGDEDAERRLASMFES